MGFILGEGMTPDLRLFPPIALTPLVESPLSMRSFSKFGSPPFESRLGVTSRPTHGTVNFESLLRLPCLGHLVPEDRRTQCC